MSSKIVKLDSARKWHRQFGRFGCRQVDVFRNAQETVGELDDVRNVCALAKTTTIPVQRVAKTQVEKKLERVFTDVMRFFSVELL